MPILNTLTSIFKPLRMLTFNRLRLKPGEGANCAAIPDITQASGKRHPNGRGWVADSATVDETAYEENPAEFRALNQTRYFGNFYAHTLKKALKAQIPIPTDDIEQVRKAMAYQSQPWYTTVSWDGRTAYEINSESVKQPVMQMFLKKMKPWMYK